MHFSRPWPRDRPARGAAPSLASKGGEGREGGGGLGRPPPPRTPRSIRRVGGGGGGGRAWGSCGRSGRHALGRAAGASCVQRLDDSRNSAIHTTYRISLRSSSLQEPRYPLLRVVATCFRFPPGGGASQSRVGCSVCASAPAPKGEGRRLIERPRAERHGGGGTPSRQRVGGEASLSRHPVARPTSGPDPTPRPLCPGSGAGAR